MNTYVDSSRCWHQPRGASWIYSLVELPLLLEAPTLLPLAGDENGSSVMHVVRD